jgi:hypothetical protein
MQCRRGPEFQKKEKQEMAITLTPVINHPTYKSWTITKADADTTTTFVHGFASAPDDVHFSSSLGSSTTNVWGWGIAVSGTGITLLNAGLTGSGGTTPGTTIIGKICAWLPHSIN